MEGGQGCGRVRFSILVGLAVNPAFFVGDEQAVAEGKLKDIDF